MSLLKFTAGIAFVILAGAKVAAAAELNLSDTPLFVGGSKTALVQLIMQRDNKLFFEAYPSYEDINADGVLDNFYKPDEIDYYGYFDSHFCYRSLNGEYLEAVSVTADKTCNNPLNDDDNGSWSGDFLNYLSMTRMDIMLRALYGGRREIDTPDKTVLRRAFVPWQNHTWGIEYNSAAIDGYSIADYSPLSEPVAGTRHLISTSNVRRDDVPYLRVRENNRKNIWEWVDKERTQGDGPATFELILDVKVCKDEVFLEESCQQYSDGGYKPTGILHEYGENNAMYFSLLTGSYENNLQGGVLRQPIASFGENEVNLDTGQFTRNPGIVTTLDAIRIPNDFRNESIANDCGFIADRAFQNGECRAWGNPVAEMMYEGMRYFSGVQTPTPDFDTTGGLDASLGLPSAVWDDPYSDDADQPYAQCAGAFQLIISDPSPSFDGDHLPGSHFNPGFSSSTLGDLDVGVIADFISENEDTLVFPSLKFIGQAGPIADGAPTPKMVNSFRDIRGQAPEAPHRQGSYYAPSVAYHGHNKDIHPTAEGDQHVQNFVLALGSPLPSIDVPVGGKTISFAPFGKTVRFCNTPPGYYPTNAIVGFTVEDVTPTTGSFRVSFEDMEQGGDNDMDAVVRYSYVVSGDEVTMNVDSLTASGCAIQHMGYTVSGSENDGVYLVVRDIDPRTDIDYELDVPPGEGPGTNWEDGVPLPLNSSNVFKPGSVLAAEQLPSPLWYAAKWGGFLDLNGNDIPEGIEWDADNDGTPDNYFPVTDPSRMQNTLRSVFNSITDVAGSASAISTSSGSLTTGNRIYAADFSSSTWTGDVLSQPISNTGVIDPTPDWSASTVLADRIAAGVEREILTSSSASRQGIAFRWPVNPAAPTAEELSAAQIRDLGRNPITDRRDSLAESRLDFIRGAEVEGFRQRSGPLGDIVHSTPTLVNPPSAFYPDNWGVDAPENAAPYSTFGRAHSTRRRVIYVGANDGMLHGFDAGSWDGSEWSAGDGSELFAYIPIPAYEQISDLTNPKYNHKYFVDSTPRAADVFIHGEWKTVLIGGLGQGGQGIYALDVTDPDKITEENAADVVLWELTDADWPSLGFTFSSPVITRMYNGKWVAIIANGYNSSERNVGELRGSGQASITIIDIETGTRIRSLRSDTTSCRGTRRTPNSMTEPTAIDIDGDNIVDTIYTGDLRGCITRFDVTDENPANWTGGELKHMAIDDAGRRRPITSAITVGSHPSGTGVMLYFGTGKYLEPRDLRVRGSNRIYGIWDKGRGTNTANLTKISSGRMLQQTIINEEAFEIDTDGDGVDDDAVDIRQSTDEPIDWDEHEGWYMNLEYLTPLGEQVLASPTLRDGRVIFNTHIPGGDECTPAQQGWLMSLGAVNGGMPDAGLFDLNGDGILNSPSLSGLRNAVNPFTSPTIVAGPTSDIILTQAEINPEATAISMASSFFDGRLTWRELEP